MIEINLRQISFGVMPLTADDGSEGKRVHFKDDDSGMVVYVPMSKEATDILVEHLTMSNDDLDAKLQQDQLDAEAAKDN